MSTIRAKTPLRVSFAGGGTDVAPFPTNEGGLVLSATLGRYVYGTLVPPDDGMILIDSPDLGVKVYFPADRPASVDGTIDLVAASLNRLAHGHPAHLRGYEISISSSAPPGSGLGSSSAVVVTLIGLLRAHLGLVLDEYEVAAVAWTVERADLGIQGGLQDQYSAAFGGFNHIEFHADHVVVNPLRIKESVVDELEHNLLLCFTGTTRRGDHIIEDQTSRYLSGEEGTLDGLRAQKELALSMKRTLLRGDTDGFGALLHEAWQHKKKMSPRISTPAIDEAYALARAEGALGGKITGAGGGGFMLVYCDFRRRHHVVQALTRFGMTVEQVSFEHRGLTTWTRR